MNEITEYGDRRMTVREVAEVFGVSDEAIKKHVRELYPDLMRNGCTTYLNEEQVTAIKQRMIPTTQVVGSITDLEAAQMLLKSAEHFKTRFEEERDARIEAEKRLAVAEPKAEFYDQVASSQDAIEMRDVAALLNIPGLGRNNLFDLLRERKIFSGRTPYREYQERGYFRVIEKAWFDRNNEAHIELVTLTTQKGLEFIRRLATGIINFPGGVTA